MFRELRIITIRPSSARACPHHLLSPQNPIHLPQTGLKPRKYPQLHLLALSEIRVITPGNRFRNSGVKPLFHFEIREVIRIRNP